MNAPLPRSAWTTSRPSSNGTWGDVGGIVVHHPGDGGAAIGPATRAEIAARLTRYREHHLLRRGWGDIGYNLAVDQAGRAWELRGLDHVGAHCASTTQPDANSRWVGVLFVVGDDEQVTTQALGAFATIRSDVLARWPSATAVVGHGQVHGAATACPGGPLRDLVATGALVRAPAQAPAGSAPAAGRATTVAVDGRWGPATTRALQRRFGTPPDGVISHQWRDASNRAITSAQFDTTRLGSALVRAVQEWLDGGIRVDGLLGSSTVAAMQRHLGTPVDGTVSPVSTLVKELQRRLAAGSL